MVSVDVGSLCIYFVSNRYNSCKCYLLVSSKCYVWDCEHFWFIPPWLVIGIHGTGLTGFIDIVIGNGLLSMGGSCH